jgi:hypothetical protein
MEAAAGSTCARDGRDASQPNRTVYARSMKSRAMVESPRLNLPSDKSPTRKMIEMIA